MSVTADQWAQAEAERQVQADLVQTLNNEGRRLGSEENNNLLEILRTQDQTGCASTDIEPERITSVTIQPPKPPAGRGIIDTRVGKLPSFSGDESTWGDWSFKLRSVVSAMDFQLGQILKSQSWQHAVTSGNQVYP